MTAPDHEEDKEIEDPEVDEQMDTGVQMKPQRPEEIPHDEEPDILGDDET